MRPAVAASILAVAFGSTWAADAQQVESFRDLPHRINLGDNLRVVDQSGASVTGRVVSFRVDGLTIRTEGQDRHFTTELVRQVDVSTKSKARWMLIGGGAFAVIGAAACGEAACAVFLGSLLGVPLGALISPLVPSMHLAYRAGSGPAASRPPHADGGSRASLLEDLGMRVNLGDRVTVRSGSGGNTRGVVAGLDDDTLTICSDKSCGSTAGTSWSGVVATATRYTRENLRQVSTSHGHALVGMVVGFVALAAPCMSGSRDEWDEAFGLCGGFGAGVGALVGSLIRTSTIVYPATQERISSAPAFVRGGGGIRAALRF